MYHGDIRLGDTIDIKFTTRRFTTGAPFTLAGTPSVAAYPANSTTEITAGITLTVDFDARTGLNNVRVVATGGNGYATATNYTLVITAGTVDGVSVVGECVGSFSIEARSALMPTTAARTLDVTATGAAGIDWGNIENPTTAQNLSATNIDVDQVVASVSGAVGSVTGNVGGNVVGSVGSVAAGGITAASIATDAIDSDAIAASAVTEIQAGLATTAQLVSEINDVQADIAVVQADTDNIQTRLPAALVGGRMDSNLSAIEGTAPLSAAPLNLKQLNIVNNAGDAIVASSTGGNGHGIAASGNGTGEGIRATGGAAGNGVEAIGGATSGYGIQARGVGLGAGISAEGANDVGINALGDANPGIYAQGNDGIVAFGSDGDGIDASSGGGNGHGINASGNGSGEGLRAAGGATGHGIAAIGGVTSGDGLLAQSGGAGAGLAAVSATGDAISAVATGGGNRGVRVTSAASDGISVQAAGEALFLQSTADIGVSIISGPGSEGVSISGDLHGVSIQSLNNGHGMQIVGGPNGATHGIASFGGATAGDGILASASGNGDGIECAEVGVGNFGLRATFSDKTGYSIGVGGITSLSFAANAIDAAALDPSAGQDIADEILNRNLAGGGSGNTRNIRNALRTARNRVIITGLGAMTVYEEDDATPAWTAVATRAAGVNPITEVDPA